MKPSLEEDDLQMLLAARCHTGVKNLESEMSEYVYKRTSSGLHIINLEKT